jgi:hypothetical protein
MATPYPIPFPSAVSIPDHFPSPTRSLSQYKESGTSFPDDDSGSDGNLIDRMQIGAKAAVVIGMIFGVIFIIAFSMWFCCGCCGVRDKRRGMAPNGARRIPLNTETTGTILPLHTIQSTDPSRQRSPPTNPSPPSYEEVVSPRNQAPPGGMLHSRPMEDDGMIADGKTPLSEIVFEDVVLDRPHTGESSSQTFEQRHHGAGGDTRGHTNT